MARPSVRLSQHAGTKVVVVAAISVVNCAVVPVGDVIVAVVCGVTVEVAAVVAAGVVVFGGAGTGRYMPGLFL